MEPGHRHFPIRVPEPYLSRIEPGNPRDPLLRQVMPEPAESEPAPGYVTDPLSEFADASASADGGLIHKYQSRALLVVTGACAINCRYCFRRHFPYGDHQLGGSGWEHPWRNWQRTSASTRSSSAGATPGDQRQGPGPACRRG